MANNFGASRDPQWGRFVSIQFRNTQTGLITEIDSSVLRIQFEYTKLFDESNDSTNGKIVIYGLTPSTFDAIGDRMTCELTLSAGYLYSKANPPRELFKAVVMGKSYDKNEGDSISTFEILGEDFIKKNITHKLAITMPEQVRILDVIEKIGNTMNIGWAFEVPKLSDVALQDKLADYIGALKLPYGYTATQTPAKELARLCKAYGFNYSIQKEEIRLSIDDAWLPIYIERAEKEFGTPTQPTVKAASNKSATPSTQVTPKTVTTNQRPPTYEQLTSEIAILLNADSGLIGHPTIKNVEFKKAYDQALQEDEEIVRQDAPRIKKNKKGEVVIDKETGKPKLIIPKKKTIVRRQVECVCYINASIVPRVQINLETSDGLVDGTYRCRNVRIKGDTEDEEFFMYLTLNGDGGL